MYQDSTQDELHALVIVLCPLQTWTSVQLQLSTRFAAPVTLCARVHAPGWVDALVIILFSLTADLDGSRTGIRLPLSACCMTSNNVMCKDGCTKRSFAARYISTLSSRSISECTLPA
jgi:hypothetical protein